MEECPLGGSRCQRGQYKPTQDNLTNPGVWREMVTSKYPFSPVAGIANPLPNFSPTPRPPSSTINAMLSFP